MKQGIVISVHKYFAHLERRSIEIPGEIDSWVGECIIRESRLKRRNSEVAIRLFHCLGSQKYVETENLFGMIVV